MRPNGWTKTQIKCKWEERGCPHILSNLFTVKIREAKYILVRILRHYTVVPWSRTDGNTMLAPCRKAPILIHVPFLNSDFVVMTVSTDLCCCQSYIAWQPFN